MNSPMMGFLRRVHFVGIGGVGMSGIARLLLNLGYRVSGSDLKATEVTRALARAGARVFVGHRARNAAGAEVVVVSSAVASDNPETAEARRRGVPVIHRAEMLAELARLKKTVTVSGTHGKTTTTSMVAMALAAAGAEPTLIVGGQVTNFRANALLGMGEYLVAEADESDGSFLRLSPLVAVVTNVDTDHLDYYGGMARLKAAFLEHLRRVPFYGAAVVCADDPALRAMAPAVGRPVITYGFSAGAEWRARLLPPRGPGPWPGARAALFHRGRRVGALELRVCGRHNVSNALAAVAAGRYLGFGLKGLLRGLAEFRGVGRRMERLGEAAGVTFLDDYGHHPTEVRATLEAVAEGLRPRRRAPVLFPRRGARGSRLLVLFQPHRFSRTKLLHREFGRAFGRADRVYVLDIYPAGEKPLPGVSSRLILDALRRAGTAAEPFTRVVDLVRELRPGDVVLTLGAGDVWKTGLDLKRRLEAGAFSPV